ncbi:hypothetical protein [Rhodoferax sp.]|uniref:hypothetical protein n=1 Tax=Rhodoferax sp. TaxID=50421 RepID=UPI00261FF686|nr:hypothetical protein [Rhodoferax sp.]MDD3936129.1 hypothetical protein [Rhodoferax sp.]
MPRNTAVFQIFVASPSDVADERRLLEGIITELNQVWSKNLGISFELLKWETNVRPSFATDPQAVINEQIGLDYDVFIGIFWGRIGTATPRATSGTLEEFERAYSKYQLTNTSPEIMIYFKDAGIPPSKIDPEQLQKVNAFRESLTLKGGLYSIYEDQSGFESSLRSHLSVLAQKFSTHHRNLVQELPSGTKQGTQELNLIPEDDDYGILDYTEIYTSRLAEVNAAMTSIGEATKRLGEQLTQRTTEMQAADKSNTKDVRRNAKRAADDMNVFADVVKTQVSVMTVSREVAFDALSNALSLQTDFATDKSEFLSIKSNLISLIENASFARQGTSNMRFSAASMPRLTKELNVAKRAVVTQLDLVIIEFDKIIFTLKNIAEAIDRMIGRS